MTAAIMNTHVRDNLLALGLRYTKATPKTVNTTVAATDLLNAEFTVAAAALGTTGQVRLTAWGDYLNNSGGNQGQPRLQLLFGGTTFIDTGVTATAIVTSATRYSWWLQATIQNANASNLQTVTFQVVMVANPSSGIGNAFTTGTGAWNEGAVSTNVVATGAGVNSGLAVDTTAAKALVLNVINASASAAYETKLFGALAEVVF